MSLTRFTKQPTSIGRQSLWNEYKTCISDTTSGDFRKTKLDNSSAEQRKKLIEKGRHFLLYCSSDSRFSREIREVIETNLDLNKKWEPRDGEVALEALEKYTLNTLRSPWKNEFHTIKTYSGFFKARVQSRLNNAGVLLSEIGYERNGDHSFVMKGRTSSSSMQMIAFEMFLGCQECWIQRQIFDRVRDRGYSVNQVYTSRKESFGNIESCVKLLLDFFIPNMKPIIGSSSDNVRNHDESDNGVQNLKNDSAEYHNNRTEIKPSKVVLSKPIILPRYATSKLSGSDPVPGYTTSLLTRSDTVTHAVHLASVHGLGQPSCETNNSDLFKPRTHDDIISKSHQIVHEKGSESRTKSKPGLPYLQGQEIVNNSLSDKEKVISKIAGNPHKPGLWRISGHSRKRPANGLKDDEQRDYSAELQTDGQLPLGDDFYELTGDKKPLLPQENDSRIKFTGENNIAADHCDLTSPTAPNIGLNPSCRITGASRGIYPASFTDSEKLNTILQDIQKDAETNNKKDIHFSTFGKEEQVVNANRRSVYDNCPENDSVPDSSELPPNILDVRTENLTSNVGTLYEYKDCTSGHEKYKSLPLFDSSSMPREIHSTAHTAPLRMPVEQCLLPDSTGLPRWQCQECTYCNAMRDLVCATCFKSRLKKSEKIPLKSGGPECTKCTFVNSEKAESCVMCGSVLEGCPTYI